MMEIFHIFVTDEAHAAVVHAALQAKQDGHLELGGSLLSIEANGSVLVAYAVPTGPAADRGPAHILTDADFQNQAMQRIRSQLPMLHYIGDWHIHPMWLPDLSNTDRNTARKILLDEGTKRDQIVLLLGTSPPGGNPVVLAFVARLSHRGAVVIDKMPITRVANDSVEVVSRLGRPLPPLVEVLRNPSRRPPAIQVQDDVQMIRIIEDDLTEVRKSLGAEATLWNDEDRLTAVIHRGGREAFVVFPPEYPLGAPQVFAGGHDETPLVPVALRFGWSTLHRLADPVSEALSPRVRKPQTRSSRPADPPPRAHWFRSILAFFGVRLDMLTRAKALASNKLEVHS